MIHEGKLFVISGPTAVGKGTLVNALIGADPHLKLSISATTRTMRKGEVEGESYFFKSEEEFQSMIAEDAFLEYASVHGMHYGTPRAYVDEMLASGSHIILEIDPQGALQVKKKKKDAILIFIVPPSLESLFERLKKRGTETEEQIEKRMQSAIKEFGVLPEYDYVVVNDEIQSALKDLQAIFRAENLRVDLNDARIKSIIKDLNERGIL